MKPRSEKDDSLYARLPSGKWFAAGAVSVHSSKLTRLVKLGLLKRRIQPYGLSVSRTWDYMKIY